MYDSWTCLMVQKGPGMLDDQIRSVLKKAACCLNLSKLDSMRIREDRCEGHIETEWRSHSVGSRCGILFRSAIEASRYGSDFRVNFLLSTADLERGREILEQHDAGEIESWRAGTGTIPLPELYDFSNLSNWRPKALH